MSLDLRTMMATVAALSLLLAGLLVLAGLHAGSVRGIRQWALASLSISIGLAFSIVQPLIGSGWPLVAGSALLMSGICLQYAGIRAFKEEPYNWTWLVALPVLVLVQAYWFVFIHPDANLRSIGNSVLLGAMCIACARSLLIPIRPPLRTAYWFTGFAYAILAVVLMVRIVVISVSHHGTYGLYSPMLINPVTFFAAGIFQLFLTFGFVLMLNYRLATELADLAAHDSLTGAFNRRSLEDEAERLLARCARTGDVLAVMLIDVDHFKSVNDRFGHPVGDEVLRRLAAVSQGAVRTDDYFARYGGEEFCVLLPASSEEEAVILAERLRQRYAETRMEFNGEILHSTVSIGVADSRKRPIEFSMLLAAADQALYRAKQTGRNRVVAFSHIEAAVSA